MVVVKDVGEKVFFYGMWFWNCIGVVCLNYVEDRDIDMELFEYINKKDIDLKKVLLLK